MTSLDQQLRLELQSREAADLGRHLRVVPEGALDLASNDYLGLARHPDVVEAACEAARCFGAGARASRLVSGHNALHEQLEAELARFKGCQAALLFPSGYAANLAVVSALARRDDVILCDKRNHASLVDACRLAGSQGARVRYYNSLEKLLSLLRMSTHAAGANTSAVDEPRVFIVSDAVYSMDGDLANVPRLHELARGFNATLVLDDAHGTGTLGATGRGALEHFGFAHGDAANIIQVGTLSKALGGQGGFVAGSLALIDWLVNAARPFIYTTAIAPPLCGAALESLRIIKREPQRVARLQRNGKMLGDGLRALGFDVPPRDAPIVPVVAGSSSRALAWSEELLRRGVWCPAIRPPTVPQNSSRLRVCVSATLDEKDMTRILQAFDGLQLLP